MPARPVRALAPALWFKRAESGTPGWFLIPLGYYSCHHLSRDGSKRDSSPVGPDRNDKVDGVFTQTSEPLIISP